MATGPTVLLWGAKSQARIVEAILRRQGVERFVLFDHTLAEPAFPTPSPFVSRPEDLRLLLPSCSEAVVCIGGRHGAQRAAISEGLRDRFGLLPRSVISPFASIDPEAELSEGVQILMGACIGLAAHIGPFALVNTNATIDHECKVDAGVHVMGSAAVAGRVRIGAAATIGTNATILPGVTVSSGAQVGAGSVVRKDVGQNEVMIGVPARRLRVEAPVLDLSVISAI